MSKNTQRNCKFTFKISPLKQIKIVVCMTLASTICFDLKKTENMYNCKYMFEFTYLAKNLLKWKSVSIEDEEDSTPYLISLHNLQSKSC